MKLRLEEQLFKDKRLNEMSNKEYLELLRHKWMIYHTTDKKDKLMYEITKLNYQRDMQIITDFNKYLLNSSTN